jgi:hypothetical protein
MAGTALTKDFSIMGSLSIPQGTSRLDRTGASILQMSIRLYLLASKVPANFRKSREKA